MMTSKQWLLCLMAESRVGLLVARREDSCRVLSEQEGGTERKCRWALADVNAFPKPIVPALQSWPTGKSGMWDSPAVPEQWQRLFEAIDPSAAADILDAP
jgi:hypothetical protein